MEIETFLSFNEKSGVACPIGNVLCHFYFLFTTVMKILVSCTENPNFFIEVLDEQRLFIDKKVIFSNKKKSVGLPSSVCRPEFKFVSTTSIRTTEPIFFLRDLSFFMPRGSPRGHATHFFYVLKPVNTKPKEIRRTCEKRKIYKIKSS
jgi:hypothetical protein